MPFSTREMSSSVLVSRTGSGCSETLAIRWIGT
jgi:hypothetical protein